jgi:hypothetical protein
MALVLCYGKIYDRDQMVPRDIHHVLPEMKERKAPHSLPKEGLATISYSPHWPRNLVMNGMLHEDWQMLWLSIDEAATD